MLYWSLLVIAMMRQYDCHNVQRDVIFKQDDLLWGKNCIIRKATWIRLTCGFKSFHPKMFITSNHKSSKV